MDGPKFLSEEKLETIIDISKPWSFCINEKGHIL